MRDDTDALVGVLFGGPRPRSVVVERLASLAVDACGVVATLTRQLNVPAVPRRPRRRPAVSRPSTACSPAAGSRERVDRGARRRVPVTLAPAADGEV